MHTHSAPALTASFSVIAERFRRAGQHDRAVALCREGLGQFPDHLSARVTLGCALLDLGLEVEALKELQAVIKRAPDNLAAIRGLAELHARGVEEHEGQDWQEEASFGLEAPEVLGVLDEAPLLVAPTDLEEVPGEAPTWMEEVPVAAPTWMEEVPVAAPTWIEEVPVAAPTWLEELPVAAPTWMEEGPEVASTWFEAAPEIVGTPLAFVDAALTGAEEPVADVPVFAEAAAEPLLDLGDAVIETLDDLDPALEPAVMAAPLQFEIEDVIDEAMEPDTLDDFDPELPPATDAEPDRLELSARHSPPAIPVPELTSGPIAVLDEWLTRIRARRAALLSEYAAS